MKLINLVIKTEDGKFMGTCEFEAGSALELSQMFSMIANAGDNLMPGYFDQDWEGYKPKPVKPEPEEKIPAPDTTHAGKPCWFVAPWWAPEDGKRWLHISGAGWIAIDAKLVAAIPDTTLITHWRDDRTKILYRERPPWKADDGYKWINTIAGWCMTKV